LGLFRKTLPGSTIISANDAVLLRSSALFDSAWYHRTYPDTQVMDPILHYLEHGSREGRDPSAFFSTSQYLSNNADVAAAGLNALAHWLRHGQFEGRLPPAKIVVLKEKDWNLQDLCNPFADEGFGQSATGPIKFSVLTPTHNTERSWLLELYQTLRNQTYGNWEWVICDDGSTRSETINTLREILRGDPRVKVTFSSPANGISAATNQALAAASGDYVALVDHDDLLSRDVLSSVFDAIRESAAPVEMLYTDECKLSLDGRLYDFYFKPSWSPVFLENTMYIGHLTIYATELVRKIGGFRSEVDGTQDFDLALRAALVVTNAVHVDCIGYLWRAVPGSTASSLDSKSYAIARQERAVAHAASLRSPNARVKKSFETGYWRTDYPIDGEPPLLSYVIPTAAGRRNVRGESVDLLVNCISNILDKNFYPNVEFVVIHNGNLTADQVSFLDTVPALKLIHYDSAQLNLAKKINLGVKAASGEFVCLLNDDVEAITEEGGIPLIGLMQVHSEIGVIAPLCIFEDGRTQHNGVILLEQGPSHAGIMHPPTARGHFGNLRCRREVFAVTGAMLFVRRQLYMDVGGFDEGLPLNYNDVDFCLRVRAKGLSCVVDPETVVYHYESASKVGTFKSEKEALFIRWPGLTDPYFNARFVQRDPAYTIAPFDQARTFGDAITFERWFDLKIANRAARPSPRKGPKLSLCVSVYNQPVDQLREMFTSYAMQTYRNSELIILDNGSSAPETLRWLESIKDIPDVRLIHHEENQGIMGGQRALAREARGDFMIPIDADDFLTADALQVLAAAITAAPEGKIFYSDEFKSNTQSDKFSPFFKTDFDPILITNCCYPGHLMAIHLATLRQLGGYDDDRSTWCHDWDTTLRALAAGIEPIHVPELLYAWRINPGSTASAETGAKPEAVASQRFVLERLIASRGMSAVLSPIPNTLGENTGMWTIQANRPVESLEVLDAEALWTALEPAHLLRGAAGRGAWVAILLASGSAERCDSLQALSAPALLDDRVKVVSGVLSDASGERVLWAGGVFTPDGVIDPSVGDTWRTGGYHGRLFCQRCTDVASGVNVLIDCQVLLAALDRLQAANQVVTADTLMVTLGLLSASSDWLVAVTPVLRAALPAKLRAQVPIDRNGLALENANLTMSSRWYNADLKPDRPYEPRDFT
jgi:GT2 family glycosyltransferase